MNKDLDALLDECIDRMNSGESLEECLASYPEHSGALRPLLTTVRAVHQDSSAIPGATARSVTRRHLDAALAHSDRVRQKSQRRTRPFWGWARVLATVTTALAVAALGFGLYQLQAPATAPVNAQANFNLLISDEPNDIGDFSSLEVTISKFGALHSDEPVGWEEFEFEPVVVDLTLLPGLNAQEIWNGILPEGQYNGVFIYVDDVTGILDNGENGEEVTTKLPSGKFHLSTPFTITADGPAIDFVYDITVIKAGQSGKYILKPQLSQSGANQEFHQVGELVIEVVDGEVAPGELITILVTHEGSPVADALVTINDDVEVDPTDADGLTSFIVPDKKKLNIKAVKDDLEGKLKIDLG
jgi:hypothetical protein